MSCKKHQYKVFSRYLEKCAKCGAENYLVTAWRRRVLATMDNHRDTFVEPHPYIKLGWWTLTDYKRAMKSK